MREVGEDEKADLHSRVGGMTAVLREPDVGRMALQFQRRSTDILNQRS